MYPSVAGALFRNTQPFLKMRLLRNLTIFHTSKQRLCLNRQSLPCKGFVIKE